MVEREYPLRNVAKAAQCLAEAVDLAARIDLPIVMIDAGLSGGGEPRETHIGRYYVDGNGKVFAKAFAISPESVINPEFGEDGTISLREAKKAIWEFGIRYLNGSLMVFDEHGMEIEDPNDTQILSAVSDIYFNQVPWQKGIIIYCA